MEEIEKYMQRAISLAELGRGNVSPNPMVGCVIVHQGEIIGEGFHRQYGEAHAEVNAINNVKKTDLLKEATLFVSLEPCSHYGKTPPCADLIVSHKIPRVFICNTDPNPLVAGRGIKKLKDAGIEVVTGILEEMGKMLNKGFFTSILKHRPYIILKWAETGDGFVARENFDSKWISNTYSRKLVHKWRAEEDAILVGTNTAKYDNPRLNVRDWTGKNPVRIVIDKSLKLDKGLNLFNQQQQTFCYNLMKSEVSENLEFVQLDKNNFIQNLVSDLNAKNLQSVIIEGGSQTLNAFIESNLWDEARVFKSKTQFGKGIPAPRLQGYLEKTENCREDLLFYYKNPSS
ncbi:bifunctional diaminohydroxyphosphoribosylaminopyrimidine deaminase/5-amino-6-(5-phosphoribosylamino)uracil reductase RibD [Flexithrix dorotheae]|uniref:bifunctional diaminohydroxyphosphoribosylaminopyrimidine deaminase/5-amino-6-(5-phosphoribosylamino)uracil reductase RibD n=1 Tax=Flexithrix dorotheae TaxID=70993 RepID=UPI0003689EB8|nr:bifunctional diaminohydroxyphosphoribosylaminopyrimidine deaminase/5-amino-6-(5-phosphoribosylamino)uracil reductase RibD [Flexithrix dorotheae]